MPAVSELTHAAQRVLHTLWFYQAQSSVTWGFKVLPAAPDYTSFLEGAQELAQRGLAFVDDRGLVGLTAVGKAYCRRHAAALKGPAAWSQFQPA